MDKFVPGAYEIPGVYIVMALRKGKNKKRESGVKTNVGDVNHNTSRVTKK